MKCPNINLNQLITFFFVAKCESLTQAAEKLYVTQPAVSMQIKALEAYLGVSLLYFKNRKVCLTENGQKLLSEVERLYGSVIEIEHLFVNPATTATFGIGIAASLAMHFYPVVEKFKERHPTVRVIVRDGPSLGITADLLAKKLDVCIIARLDVVPDDLLVQKVVNKERMVLVDAPGSPLLSKADISWVDLDGYPLIVHCEGSVLRKNVLSAFARRGMVANIVAEVDNIEYMKQLVQQGVGAAFMFFPNIRREVSQSLIELVPFSFGEVGLGVDVVMRRGPGTNPLCEDFLAIVTEALENENI